MSVGLSLFIVFVVSVLLTTSSANASVRFNGGIDLMLFVLL